jgi:hypothetical protein
LESHVQDPPAIVRKLLVTGGRLRELLLGELASLCVLGERIYRVESIDSVGSYYNVNEDEEGGDEFEV